ncbi:hypothetical protein LZ32DRAFT_225290 [Colletotrichum eremochloae]|nr:hypothetical protein LZ32DRAFT_225290 [Colletotrichum eremochloae]
MCLASRSRQMCVMRCNAMQFRSGCIIRIGYLCLRCFVPLCSPSPSLPSLPRPLHCCSLQLPRSLSSFDIVAAVIVAKEENKRNSNSRKSVVSRFRINGKLSPFHMRDHPLSDQPS